MHTRIALSSIPTLTFYKDSITLSRRTSPIQQLVCVGKPCALYSPNVVRCKNVGGSDDQVDWKCEADLPASLRFGRVEVSCEGWSAPGDPYILKGSCGLEYRLIQIPKGLREDNSHSGLPTSFQFSDIAHWLFMMLWLGVLLLIAYSIIKSCFGSNSSPTDNTNPRPPRTYNSGGSGWFPGDYRSDGYAAPPPPYTKTSPGSSQSSNWTPGFWTGAALGSLGTSIFNNRRQSRPSTNQAYDWERERPSRSFSSPINREEGPSNLGPMRRSTGLGGSNVR